MVDRQRKFSTIIGSSTGFTSPYINEAANGRLVILRYD